MESQRKKKVLEVERESAERTAATIQWTWIESFFVLSVCTANQIHEKKEHKNASESKWVFFLENKEKWNLNSRKKLIQRQMTDEQAQRDAAPYNDIYEPSADVSTNIALLESVSQVKATTMSTVAQHMSSVIWPNDNRVDGKSWFHFELAYQERVLQRTIWANIFQLALGI